MSSLNSVIVIATIVSLLCLSSISEGRLTSDTFREFYEISTVSDGVQGTKWAVLVAGSNEFWNYRHQADICHAYQILKRGGLKDENIIVFMYDDIAFNKENPKQGVIINHPKGKNLYPGVVKDYTGKAVNITNFYAALLGNQTAVRGGSRKVLKSGPNDHVFIYYTDHGGPGILSMPMDDDFIYAKDFINVLKQMHASKTYKKMVIYVEACESGSIFEGLLPNDLNIYVMTASRATEDSYAAYCASDVPIPGYPKDICLGDEFSVAWMEDSDKHNPVKETLEEQYVVVEKRTAEYQYGGSHVMQYGDLLLSNDTLASYFVADSKNGDHFDHLENQPEQAPLNTMEQHEADLFYFEQKVRRAPESSNERVDAQKQLDEVLAHRKHVDQSVEAIGKALFGEANGPSMLKMARPAGQTLVDDWDCLKAMVKTYQTNCGLLKTYGGKHMRAFANMCNAGIGKDQMAQASIQVCGR